MVQTGIFDTRSACRVDNSNGNKYAKIKEALKRVVLLVEMSHVFLPVEFPHQTWCQTAPKYKFFVSYHFLNSQL